MADTYHVIVTNPGGTDVNDTNPLRFSLPDTNSKFSLGFLLFSAVLFAAANSAVKMFVWFSSLNFKLAFSALNITLDSGGVPDRCD